MITWWRCWWWVPQSTTSRIIPDCHGWRRQDTGKHTGCYLSHNSHIMREHPWPPGMSRIGSPRDYRSLFNCMLGRTYGRMLQVHTSLTSCRIVIVHMVSFIDDIPSHPCPSSYQDTGHGKGIQSSKASDFQRCIL